MSLPERSASFIMATMLHIETELVNSGIEKEAAEKISQNAVDNLRKDYGGEQIYFPKGKEFDAMMKHHEIYKRFTGNNQVELSKEFNMAVPVIYRIIAKANKEYIDKRQPQLF